MEVRCPFCDSTLEVSSNATRVRCGDCGSPIPVRDRERLSCPKCRAELTAPPGARVIVCGHCRERVELSGPARIADRSSISEPVSFTDDEPLMGEGGAEEETSLLHIPQDYEAERLRAMKHAFAPDYDVLCPLGKGGMGAIYKAMQKQPERVVVLKVMLDGKFSSPRHRMRFEREVHAVARLKHPGIVAVYECGEVASQPYFSMEYVDGCNVREYVLRNKLNKRQICQILVQISKTIAYAHAEGVIHRDIKPNNVLIDKEGNPRLLDFGLARIIGDGSLDEHHMSTTGEVIGTPSYMSPEQTVGRPQDTDGRSDIYSLGVLFYELLTDTLPYRVDRERPLASLRIVREYVPHRPSDMNPRIDNDLEAVVMKCLEKDPDDRYQSMTDLTDDLGRYLRGEPVVARPCTSLYYLRKMMWRNRSVVMPIGAALLFVVALTAVFIWRIEARSRDSRIANEDIRNASEDLVQERQKLQRMIEELRGQTASVEELLAQGQWDELAKIARARSGEDGFPEKVTEAVRLAVITSAANEAARIDDLIEQLRFREAIGRIEEVRQVAESMRIDEVTRQMNELSAGFHVAAWQSVAAQCRRGRGAAMALERFLSQCPDSPRAIEAMRMLDEIRGRAQFAEWPFSAEEARRRQAETARVLDIPRTQQLRLDSFVDVPLVLIPAGEFVMGDDAGTGSPDQRPAHRVRIGSPFYLSATEITQDQYTTVMGGLPPGQANSGERGSASRLPVAVSCQQAQAFCRALSRSSDRIVRLPSEAEWEYACRGGSAALYGHGEGGGDEKLAGYAWWKANAGDGVRPTGLKMPGTWGLFDMHGNMMEWCRDWYGPSYYHASPTVDPRGPEAGVYRVLRGGGWSSPAEELTAAARRSELPSRAGPAYGFRICIQVFSEHAAPRSPDGV